MVDIVKQLCIKSYEITAQQGKEYTTTVPAEDKEIVMVFSNYWVPVPKEHFVPAEEMMDKAAPVMTMKPLVDKELHYIEDTIGALKKIEDTDCTEDVWETIQAAIEDLGQCV